MTKGSIDDFIDALNLCLAEIDEKESDGPVKAVYPNEKEKVVAVLFDDGKEVVRCAKGDHFDVNVGVAIAIAQHIYGTKTHFHKKVAKLTHTKEEKK